MAGKIFINYRRGDDPGHTGRLFDRLQDEFEPQQLFLDVDNIAPGLDFIRVLDERVAECDVLLAVIGKGWIDARDKNGKRRLDDPDDFVRIEIEAALNRDKRVIPVLVGEAHMPGPHELPATLQPLARRNAVRLTHERFRADTHGLVKALQETLAEIDAARQSQVATEAEQQAQRQRQLREAEAARRIEEEERRKKAEAAERERAAEEQRRQQAAARRRLEEDRAFAAAKRTATILAFDAFLAAYPASSFADEARTLKAVLEAREQAYQRTSVSEDPAVLRSFLATYKKGADVDRVRSRLRLFEPRRAARQATIIGGALAGAVLVGAAAFWIETAAPPSKPEAAAPNLAPSRTAAATAGAAPIAPPSTLPSTAPTALPAVATKALPAPPGPVLPADQAAWAILQQTTDEAALKRFAADYPNSPLRKDAASRIAALEAAQAAKPVPPSPDQIAWSLLKDTNDQAALQRFIAQYPDSALRNDAAARVAALQAQAAKAAAPPSPDQIAWNLVKDSKEADELQRFIKEFPKSTERPEAEQRIAALAAETPAAAPVSPPDPHELARSLQLELQRVGCFTGTVNGEFDTATKSAWHNFTRLASIKMPDGASPEAINAVRGFDKRVCPLMCPAGDHAEGEACVRNARPKRTVTAAPTRPREPGAAAPRTGGKCFSFQGRQFCE